MTETFLETEEDELEAALGILQTLARRLSELSADGTLTVTAEGIS